MALSQKQLFLEGEADEWFGRNPDAGCHPHRDQVLRGIADLGIAPRRVIEVGCGNGWRLAEINKDHGSECRGIDPSQLAIAGAPQGISVEVGTAEAMPFEDASADLLIFGFCLYLTDPTDHFRIAAEADRVLVDGGVLCILDFAPGRSYKNEYRHAKGIFSHKMDFSKLFTRHPAYRLLHRVYGEHDRQTFHRDEAVTADFLLKDYSSAFPPN